MTLTKNQKINYEKLIVELKLIYLYLFITKKHEKKVNYFHAFFLGMSEFKYLMLHILLDTLIYLLPVILRFNYSSNIDESFYFFTYLITMFTTKYTIHVYPAPYKGLL